MKMKRYELTAWDTILPSNQGSLVYWDDVEPIIAQRDQLRESLEIASLQIGKLADLTNGRIQAFAMMTKKGVDTALAEGGEDD